MKLSNLSKERRNYLMEDLDFDYILDEHDAPDFYEMVISIGGDVCRYRCYGDTEDEFRVYAK